MTYILWLIQFNFCVNSLKILFKNSYYSFMWGSSRVLRVLRVLSSTFWFLRPLCATWWHSRAFLKCSREIQKYRILMNLNIGDFRSKNTGIQSLNFGHPLNWSWTHNFDLMSFFLFFKNIFVFQLRIIGSCQKLVFRSNKNLYENLLLVLGNFNTRDLIKISAILSKKWAFWKK